MNQEFKKYMCYKAEGNTAINLFLPHTIKRDQYQAIKSLKMCNSHATDSVTVDLYLIDTNVNYVGTDYEGGAADAVEINYYILKSVIIPLGTTLVLDEEDVDYDSDKYILTINLSAADSIVDLKFINKI